MLPALFTCTHGDVRLAGGWTINEGLVQICLSNSWALVCDSSWNVQESTVVCRQLIGELNPSKKQLFAREIGCIHTEKLLWYTTSFFLIAVTLAIHYAWYIYHSWTSGPIFTSSCSGSENQLLNCSFSTVNYCNRRYTAGVRCYGKYYRWDKIAWSQVPRLQNSSIHFSSLVVDSGCTEGDVRLAGGETAMEGRVEVCHNQMWWAVSGSSNWDFRDATVVCRHLHYLANCKSCNEL